MTREGTPDVPARGTGRGADLTRGESVSSHPRPGPSRVDVVPLREAVERLLDLEQAAFEQNEIDRTTIRRLRSALRHALECRDKDCAECDHYGLRLAKGKL